MTEHRPKLSSWAVLTPSRGQCPGGPGEPARQRWGHCSLGRSSVSGCPWRRRAVPWQGGLSLSRRMTHRDSCSPGMHSSPGCAPCTPAGARQCCPEQGPPRPLARGWNRSLLGLVPTETSPPARHTRNPSPAGRPVVSAPASHPGCPPFRRPGRHLWPQNSPAKRDPGQGSTQLGPGHRAGGRGSARLGCAPSSWPPGH